VRLALLVPGQVPVPERLRLVCLLLPLQPLLLSRSH
jgi:hypothetical protein